MKALLKYFELYIIKGVAVNPVNRVKMFHEMAKAGVGLNYLLKNNRYNMIQPIIVFAAVITDIAQHIIDLQY